jgi:hypothetical protein
MKLVQVNFHFEYADVVDGIVERHQVRNYVRHPRIVGYDSEGKHDGTQVFPGNTAVIQALVEDERVDPLLAELARFRDEKRAHRHVEAFVMPVERQLSVEFEPDGES